MPRLDFFDVEIKTGARGFKETPRFAINGFELPFEQPEGGAGPGETLKVTGAPGSFPHTLHLIGPSGGAGPWDIESLRITYFMPGEEPYTLEFEPVTLEEETNLNIWHPRPPEMFDV